MSNFELGQFLIMLGCKVDLTKFGWALLQRREWGLQHSEPATGRRGMMLQIQQVSSWRSIYGSEMGDPMLLQLLGGFDQTIPTMTIAQTKLPASKKPFRPVKTFQVTPPVARIMSPAGSAASSMQLGVAAATYTAMKKPVRMDSPSPGASDRKRTEH